MKKSVSLYDFRMAFATSNRLGKGREQFSYPALKGIFEYLTAHEEDAGVEIQFDLVGICCEFAEVDLTDLEELDTYKENQEIWRDADSVVFAL